MKFSVHPALIHLLVVLLVILVALSVIFPWRTAAASAPPEKFSVERAWGHLPVLAHAPHPNGSPAQAQVRDYLVGQLTGLGLEVDVQRADGIENVVARLRGTDPSGAVLILAHSDSYHGPGAADNGCGVAALLEIMRALSVGPAPRNDVIALFDDGEELPDEFTGTKAFIRQHAWMKGVRVAIGLDTAVRGPTSVDDTGDHNGWMVRVLARIYTNGAWTSMSGGGNYDTKPFRKAGVQVLELEDNYPFVEQHTPLDVPAIVRPASLQQLGEQGLAAAREISGLDLTNTRGEQRTFLFVPFVGLLHYPQFWALPLAVLAEILLLAAFGLAVWRKQITWRGLGTAFAGTVLTAGTAALGVAAVWKAAPAVFGWPTHLWHDWPEVIPPNGWLILILTNAVVLVLMAVVYRFLRRWSSSISFSLVGLLFISLVSLAAAISEPRGAALLTWPVLVGAAVWVGVLAWGKLSPPKPADRAALLAAVPTLMYVLPLIPGVFMSDGTKSVAVTSAVWVLVLAVLLPALDGLWTGAPSGKPTR